MRGGGWENEEMVRREYNVWVTGKIIFSPTGK